MVDSVPERQHASEVLESLRRTALEYVNRNQRRMRLSLQIPARGQRCRLFYGHGPITHVGGDDGTYYGVKLDCHDSEMGFSEYELEQANPDEPAWVSRFAKGKADISPFVAQDIAGQVRELLVYKRAMDSMASQFVHPKTTGMELAKSQLGRA